MARRAALTLLLLTAIGAGPGTAQEVAKSDSTGMLRPGVVRYPDGEEGFLLPDTLPFGEGEVMDFEIRYGIVNVGRARLETKKLTEHNGRPVLKILSRAKSARWIDMVYKVRDEVHSLLDVERMHSVRVSKRLREGNYEFDLVADYLHDEGLARYDDGTENELVPGSQDILSALFYVRTFPLEEGMSLKIPLHDSKKSYPMHVEVKGREVVETELGVIPCLVLEPKLESRGLFKSEGGMLIYLSDDERRLPVLLKARAPVGAFTSQLTSYKQGLPLDHLHWSQR